MKILLDEQIHYKLKAVADGTDWQLFSIKEVGWRGVKNGLLREKLNENQFDFLISADKNMPFQQNFQKMDFTIILIDTPTLGWRYQSLFISKIQDFLRNPPQALPRIVHFYIEGVSLGNKIAALKNLLPPDQILFI